MYLKTVIKNITKGNLCVASCDYPGIVFSWEVIKVRNGERETGKWKMGTKPNLNPCPISNFIFNFLLCSHFPNSLFPVPKGLSISLCHGERLSPCRRLQVDCWPFWTSPRGPQPCIERERVPNSHKWRTRAWGAGYNRKSSNTVEPCVKRTPFVKGTDGLVCFKRFFLYFLLNEPVFTPVMVSR